MRKGEKATPVYFYKPIEIEDKTADRGPERGDPDAADVLGGFTLCNSTRPCPCAPNCDETGPSASRTTRSSLRRATVPIRIGGERAFYSPALDVIRMRRTKPFTVRELRPSSPCTSSPTPAIIRPDWTVIRAAALVLFVTVRRASSRATSVAVDRDHRIALRNISIM